MVACPDRGSWEPCCDKGWLARDPEGKGGWVDRQRDRQTDSNGKTLEEVGGCLHHHQLLSPVLVGNSCCPGTAYGEAVTLLLLSQAQIRLVCKRCPREELTRL